jgi:nucleoside-diphosphate-sugar epimerase
MPIALAGRRPANENYMSAKPVCAITGSQGYVGGCVRTFLGAHGWDILELTRQPKPGTRGVAFQLGTGLAPACLAGVDALVHCAYDFKQLPWREIQSINVAGTQKLLHTARVAGVERIVCLSSISAYTGCRSLYGRAKLEIEQLALDQGALVLRPGLVYGPGPGGMFGKLAAQVRQSSVIPLMGDGSQLQYLVHHEDLSAFIAQALAVGGAVSPRLLTAAHPQPWALKQLLREIARAQDKQVTLLPLPWQLAWAGLKSAETLGLRLNFRSDSLVSLMHPNPRPDFTPNAAAGLQCRGFDIHQLNP